MRQLIVFFCVILAVLPALGQTPSLPESGTVELTDKQIQRLGIVTQASQIARETVLGSLPARIVPASTGMQAVTVPFDGVLVKIHVLPSQKVKAGQSLFTIQSRSYLDMRIGLDGARSELNTAQTALTQQKKLADEGLASKNTLLPLQADLMRAQALVDEHQKPLQGTYSAGNGRYIIKAPAAGWLEGFDLSVGQSVDSLTALTAIMQSDDLWAQIQLPAALLGKISPGDQVRYENGASGEVVSIARSIDPRTKSALLIAEVPEYAGYNPGELTHIYLSKPAEESGLVRIPSSAIIRLNGTTCVFRKNRAGFDAVKVDIAGQGGGFVIVSGDNLSPGTIVATRGLTELKAIWLEGAG